jgi:hypothetical protein
MTTFELKISTEPNTIFEFSDRYELVDFIVTNFPSAVEEAVISHGIFEESDDAA